ncbi:MAG: hypothetical protein GYB64_11090 [Chloroflexi bacterium]|nr:hypothetical protein [Chloroflexota bacterium]
MFAYWQLAAGASLADHTIIPLTGAWFALLALTLVIGYIATHLLRSGPPEGWLVVGLALLPAAAVLAASALVQPLFVPRYLLSSLVVTHLLIGLALDWLLTRAPVVGRILSIALIGFAFVVTLLLHTNDDLQRADWRGAVEVVASDYQPGDVMLTIYLSPVLYYTAQRPGEFTIIKPPPEVGIADQARATVAQGGRAWILAPLAPDFPEPETPDEWFEPTMGEAEAALLQRLNGIWVYLYTAP